MFCPCKELKDVDVCAESQYSLTICCVVSAQNCNMLISRPDQALSMKGLQQILPDYC